MGDKREPEQVCSLADDFHGRAIRAEHRVAELEARVAALTEEREAAAREAQRLQATWTGRAYWETDTGVNHRAAINRAEAAEREAATLREALDVAMRGLRAIGGSSDAPMAFDLVAHARDVLNRARAALAWAGRSTERGSE